MSGYNHPAVKRSVARQRRRIEAMTKQELIEHNKLPLPEWIKKQNWAWWFAAQRRKGKG